MGAPGRCGGYAAHGPPDHPVRSAAHGPHADAYDRLKLMKIVWDLTGSEFAGRNQLYEKFGNLNRLLAWAHGTALEAVLERTEAKTIIVDKFCEEGPFRRHLKERARACKLILQTKAEAFPAVGAASILASDAFSRKLEYLSKEYGLTLPKGAGANVDATARRLLATQGREVLARVAKVHFANTGKL